MRSSLLLQVQGLMHNKLMRLVSGRSGMRAVTRHSLPLQLLLYRCLHSSKNM